MELKAIGEVRTSVPREDLKSREGVSEIVVSAEFSEALDGIEDFSHVFVLFWMHELEGAETPLRAHPRGREDVPLVGVFATRSPRRPNPIGLTKVRLLGRQGRVLTVKGLDAFDGTPVLDLKPCAPWNPSDEVSVADWWRRLEAERTRPKS